MTKWMDIETAPHNEQFLGARVEEGRPTVYWVIRGLQLRYGLEDDLPGKGYRWNAADGMYNVTLTHWQPIEPPKPNPTKQEETE